MPEVTMADIGLDAAAIDRTADPCQDFYRYTCGGWLDRTAIPADRAHHDRLEEVRDRTEMVLQRILEKASTAGDPDPDTARLGAFYAACMNEDAIESTGLAAIEPVLGAARRVTRRSDIMPAIAQLHKHGIWAAFALEPEPDFKNATTTILFVDSAGLGLPDRDYYLEDEPGLLAVRRFYRKHVERMFVLAGRSQKAAQKAAADVMRIESSLAQVTRTQVERRDIQGMYNKIDRAGLARLARRFDWDGYFAALGRPEIRSISVTTPAYFRQLDTLLASVKPAAWSHYLEWHVLAAMAEVLPDRFGAETFLLRQLTTGQPVRAPRWKRCIAATDRAVGELLGKFYVTKAFPATHGQSVAALVDAIAKAFAARLRTLSWMNEATRQQALAKLDQMTHLIGHPATWQHHDFAGYTIDRQSHSRNVLTARAIEVAGQLAKVDKPVDRHEWLITPQTVDAYYNPLANQIVLPAAILQPPFFGLDRAVVANLGGIGMVVGHELTHGFDDMGCQFDGQGNLASWWLPEDEARFKARGQCFVDRYSAYEPFSGLHVDGKLTLAENIADLGGIELAFQAYRDLRQHATPPLQVEGLTEDQLFFVAVGQAWCTNIRDAELKRSMTVNTHAPARFRVLGSLASMPEFAEAWGCPEGTPMHPPATCEVW